MTSPRLHHPLAALLAATVAFAPAAAQTYVTRVADGNLVGVTLGNYGTLGNNFVSRAASFEYPLGSGYEHLVCGGLWVGATVPDSGFTRVTTAKQDGFAGASLAGTSEFTPYSAGITPRSLLAMSPHYSPDAVSDLDLVSEFEDVAPKYTGGTEPHLPLGIRVRQESYSWNYGGAQSVLFLRYTIRNVWSSPLVNAWVGLYTEFASGNKDLSMNWPPSGWFGKAWLAYDADFRMLREHYCAAMPVPAGCALATVPYWAGAQVLTPPDVAAGQQVTLAAWRWAPGDATRDEDAERYALMSTGTIANLLAPDLAPGTGDPCELLALGPFASIAPGDSIVVDFALLGGAEPDSIRETAYLAQAMRDAGFPEGVVPALASLASYAAAPDRVTLRWHVPAAAGATLRVQRREAAGEWRTREQSAADGTETREFVDRDVVPGGRYAYRLGIDRSDRVEFTAETWVDVPAASRFALHGARPNPVASGGQGLVAFSLARAGAVRLECFDVLGRREASVEWAALGAGEHALPLGALGALPAGLHLLRIVQGAASATARVLVVN